MAKKIWIGSLAVSIFIAWNEMISDLQKNSPKLIIHNSNFGFGVFLSNWFAGIESLSARALLRSCGVW